MAWISCQLGAREHYVTPRALHRAGRLHLLITDAWARAQFGKAAAPAQLARLGQRFHPGLAGAPIRSFTGSLLMHEAWWRLRGVHGWEHVIARNEWFQSAAAGALPRSTEHRVVFAHSYSAEYIFREAKRRGWTTVLGQIDPGPEHFALLRALNSRHPEFAMPDDNPPERYFDQWRRECDLSDRIVVNSSWSRESLCKSGIDAAKISVIPIPYEPEQRAAPVARSYPASFTSARPLRVLFVGTASLGKGIAELLQAFDTLQGAPIELRIVGTVAMTLPERYARRPDIQFVGPVDRRTVMEYYRTSDVLVFPSHSDGFGMAQVEAQSWSLPIVASRHCGEVVRHGETGLVLDEVSADALQAALRRVLKAPRQLAAFSERTRLASAPALPDLAAALLALEQ